MSYDAVVTRTRLSKPGLPISNYGQPVIHFFENFEQDFYPEQMRSAARKTSSTGK